MHLSTHTGHALAAAALVLAPAVSHGQAASSPAESASAPEPTLPAVRATATAEKESATGPVSGYAARRSATATKTDTPLLDVPQAVDVITRDAMADRGVTRVRDAVETVPGVLSATGYGGLDSGQVFSRGFFTETTYRDGFRDFSYASPRDVAVFERIEVLKGPGSVLYGSNEPGGVVNYVTKRPLFAPAYGVKLQAGSYNARRMELDAGGPLGDGRFAYRLVAAYDEADSHRDHVSSRTKVLAPSLAWRVADRTSLTLMLESLEHRYTFERGFLPEPAFFALPIDRFLEEPGQNFARNRSQRAVLMLEHQLAPDWQLRAATSVLRADAKKLNLYPIGLQADGRTLDRTYDYDETRQRDRTLQLEAVGKLRSAAVEHTLLVGVERSYYVYDYWFGSFSHGSPIDIYEPVYGQTTPPADLFTVPVFGSRYGATTHAVYLQDQLRLSDRWQLVAGLRAERSRLFLEDTIAGTASFPEQTQSRVSPRLGVVFKPSVAASLYASVSTSFKPQIFNADAAGELPKPEVGRQFELGWKQEWQGARFTAALFDLRKRNVSTTDPGDPTRTIQTGEQRSRGLELGLQGQLTRVLQINAGLALLDAEVTRDETIPVGDRLQNAPRRQANLWLKYTPRGDTGWYVGGGALYVGERPGSLPNNGVNIPAGTRLDAVAGWRGSAWNAQLNARNLADKKLYNAWGNGFVIPQPGRSFSVQLEHLW